MYHQKIRRLVILSVAWFSVTSAFAAPPDLTSPGAIDGIDREYTYNLGATGLRGWIWVDRNNVGDVGMATDQSRQILVTHAVAPASAVLAVDDVILGAIAGGGAVPNFTGDCRKAFANAITDAEKTGAGILRVKRWRAGNVSEHDITLPVLGNYSATAPFDCPKSTLILDQLRDKMVAEMIANPNYFEGAFGGSASALALLSGVKPGDPDYAEVQTRLQTFARSLANQGPMDNGLPIWDWAYALLYLSEYYLITNDTEVIAGIRDFTLTLAEVQSVYGTYGHGSGRTLPDGSGRMVSSGYGPVNAVGATASIALVMGKKALLAASQPIDPIIDTAIQRSSGFLGFYVNKGSIPYGEHAPVADNHGSNGKDAMAAVFFGLQPGRAVETGYFSRMCVAGWIGREYGHTGQGLSYFWTTLGALMGGEDAASEHLRQIRWHLDLSRRTDGSFAYDGQEQYGPGRTADNTYLGLAGYNGDGAPATWGMRADAMYLLTYSLPLKRLHITGKDADPEYTLDSAEVANAVAAATFRLETSTRTNAQLIAALNEFDPVVRHHAARGLKDRTLTVSELTSLRDLLESPNANERMGASEALGLRKDLPSLPTIVGLLNDTDVWVRAKAADSIRSYDSATAGAHRDAMMTSFIANASDPLVIAWDDPVQMANARLSLAIFGNAVQDGTPGNDIAAHTINAPKETLLYPALRIGLAQPDSYPRTGVIAFCRQRIPLADLQALFPELAYVVAYDTPADPMWSGSSRAEAMRFMGEMKMIEGIELALEMLDTPENNGWGTEEMYPAAFDAIASYGDAARHVLPKLRGYLNRTDLNGYPQLANAITTIENAITAPAQNPGLAVANPQIVVTTGAKVITLSGTSPRTGSTVTFTNVTAPLHGTLSGTAPNFVYTPNAGYTGPDHFTFQVIDNLGVSNPSAPGTVSVIVGDAGVGLKGEYYDNANFTDFKLTRTDPQINFDWGTGSPDPSMGADTFSVRWSGQLHIPETGAYTFSTLSSEGTRLFIDGVPVINNFVDQATRWVDGEPVQLTAGQKVTIQMEYYENTGSAVAKLRWTGPSVAGTGGSIIPQAYLFDSTGGTPYAHAQSVSMVRNTSQAITLTGSGSPLTYTILAQPSHGNLTGTAPDLTYTPAAGFSGEDSFTFFVNDGVKNSSPANVSISIQHSLPESQTWKDATSGNMSAAANWVSGSAPAFSGLPHYDLNFLPTGDYTVTHDLANGFQLNRLSLTGRVTLTGGNALTFVANGGSLPQIRKNSGSDATINIPIQLAATTAFNSTSGGNITLNGVISGGGGLVKNGTENIAVTHLNNTYSGGTILNSGRLYFPETAPGDSPIAPLGTGPITLNPGATLEVNRTNLSNTMLLNGGRIKGGNSFPSILSGSVTLGGITTIDMETTGGFHVSGPISGSGGLITVGTTNPRLSGSNTYTGPTTIQAGSIVYAQASSVAPGPLAIGNAAKADLDFTGNRVIASLTLGGNQMLPGSYGSTSSPATYKNDDFFSGAGTVTVLPPTTTALALTNGGSPAHPGTPLTFTATVTGASPAGDVQFFSGHTLLGTSALNGSFQAAFTTGELAIGFHEITARYLGNASHSTSVSPTLAVVISNTPAAAPTDLTATPDSGNIDLSWSPSAGAASYYVKRSLSPGGPYTVIGNPTATTFQDPSVAGGTSYFYLVSAINSAGESDDSNLATASPGLAASATSLTVSPLSTGPHGTSVTLTATVTGPATGTVTFLSGSTVIGTGTLGSGMASLMTSSLPVAIHPITAAYGGNASFGAGVSEPYIYQVTALAQTITFPALAEVGLNSAPFALTATASSGLGVSYTSSSPYVATISGNTVTIVGQGSTTITAYQTGNTTYLAASPIARTLTVIDTNSAPVVNAGPDQLVFLTGEPWSPLTLTPQLWLDAADDTTLTIDGTSVSQWADKSGFGRHATANGTARPTATPASLNGKRVITFDGNSDALNLDLDFLAGVSHSTFIVTKPTSYSNIYGAANGGAGSNSLHIGFDGPGSYRMNYWGNDYYPAITANFHPAAANLLNFVWSSGVSKQVLTNGSQEGFETTDGVIGTMSGGGRIGNVVGQGYYGGDIAEFITFTGDLSLADRQKIEGDLAHKWGLAAHLPEAHPYKNTAPQTQAAITQLAGAASDPDDDPLTTTWSVVDGPAPVVFGNVNAVDTTATFTTAGVYTLRLTSSDGSAQTTDDVMIFVRSPTGYDVWAANKGLHGIASLPGSDPDGDGLTNLQEYAFGMEPMAGGPGGAISYNADEVTNPGLPMLLNPGAIGEHALFIRRKDAGLTYTVRFSADLKEWTPGSAGLQVLTAGNGDLEAVSVPFPAAVPLHTTGSAAPRFFRVEVGEP